MKNHKKSGKAASFQTRQEAADEAVAKGQEAHELHKDTVGDIRIVVPNGDGSYAFVGGWTLAKDRAETEKAWDAAN